MANNPLEPRDTLPPVDDVPVSAQDDAEPFIPPGVLIGLAVLGFAVALVVLFTQPIFNVVGFGGLALGVLSLIAWVLVAPRNAARVLTGRTVRYGGTSLLVTSIVIVALAVLYLLARSSNVRVDLTQRNEYSLTDASRQAMTALGADPTLPRVRLTAFYDAARAGLRDADTPLFQDYQDTSNGKIEYRFVDPERGRGEFLLYPGATVGSIAVAALNEAGEPDYENAQIVPSTDQQGLTNAVVRVAASGNFIAYFLTVPDGISDQMATVRSFLEERFGWQVVESTLVELTSPEGEFRLNDPARDGEILVIPGGSAALTDQELIILQDYLAGGGDVILLAGTNINTDQTSLATSASLNEYLAANFGLRFLPSIVADLSQAFQSPLIPYAQDLDPASPITASLADTAIIFEVPNPIQLEATLPANVTVTALASSGAESYAIEDQARVTSEDPTTINPQDSDPRGPFVLVASSENSATGARLVVFSSTTVASDATAALAGNLSVMLNSLTWATDFNDFVQQITVVQDQRPQDAPMLADQNDIRMINFVTLILLPFGVLAVGIVVWYTNRERARD